MNHLAATLITFGVFALMIALLVYLIMRTASLLDCRLLWPAIVLTLLFAAGMAGMFLTASPSTANLAGHLLVTLGSNTMGVLLILVCSYVVVDLAGLITPIPRTTRLAIAAVLTLTVAAYAFANAAHVRVRHVHVTAANVASPKRIVQLTDLHLGHNRGVRHLRRVVDKVEAEKPDIVVITGDLFDSHYRFDSTTLEPLKSLSMPVFFIAGNHDGYIGVERVKRLVRATGNIRVLSNELVVADSLQIIGLDNMPADSADHSTFNKKPTHSPNIASVLATMPFDRTLPTIVLHHIPTGARYVEAAGADLYLCGHTHGGQFPPVTWLDNVMFEYNRGLHKRDSLYVYVSTGTGCTGPQMRLGTHAEIAVIDLLPE